MLYFRYKIVDRLTEMLVRGRRRPSDDWDDQRSDLPTSRGARDAARHTAKLA